ncbi:MAG: hypothetical protein HYS17_10165 [Micavibrio aeruginosavorus]|uniref:Glycosyltransferase RgtA/B/C/D-like domain-containing protein n=1 Tax=Micavibrio aeruginosavorus TaxID=349221 RepID=A0A7T5UGG2_9BACT|nr:MAG: hypothetical protein HYS17_10165 [Micavibrio aeruginosavorus]
MFAPWAFLQAQVSIPADMAWLSLAAEKFIAGARMSEAFHDSNPPLCYLIYLPVAWLKTVGLPLWVAGFAYGLGIVALFATLAALLILRTAALSQAAAAALIIGYLMPLTFLYQIEFGNKDHLIAAALLPFLLAQAALLSRPQCGRPLIWMTLILATPFILMKPHYGLLPACMLAQRFFSGRGFKVLRDPDFLCLACGVILYGLIVAVWFGDYLSDILLRVSLELYAGIVMYDVFKTAAALAVFSGLLWAFAHFAEAASEDKRCARFLAGMSFLAVIPFAVQMKGFSLHMIPYLSLAMPAAAMIAGFYLPVRYTQRQRSLGLALFFLVTGYGFSLANPYTTHNDYRNTAVAGLLRNKADSGFLMQSASTNVVIPLSVYTDKPHASRFSSFWFVRHLSHRRDPDLTAYYARMVAEDMEKYKPGVILLYHEPEPEDDVLAVLGQNEFFKKAWFPYRKRDAIRIVREEFYRRPAVKTPFHEIYDIYIRE